MEAAAKTPIKPKQATSKPQVKPDANVKIRNPSFLDFPNYLMCFPAGWDTDDRNNKFMEEMSEEELEEDYNKAYQQWMSLYNVLTGPGTLAHILPGGKDFPDAVYCANCGIVLLHEKKPIFVASNYKSEPRRGEERVAAEFFKMWGYKVERPEYFWEGEADLKAQRDRLYVGGYNIRTDIKALEWFEQTFDMEVIKVKMTDEKCYHFDCLYFPLTADTALVATELLDKADVAAIEKKVEIIPVSKKLAHSGVTNSVRTVNLLIGASSLQALDRGSPEWEEDHAKEAFLEKVAVKNGLEYVPVNLSEFEKSGAACSCLVAHVNRSAYSQPVV